MAHADPTNGKHIALARVYLSKVPSPYEIPRNTMAPSYMLIYWKILIPGKHMANEILRDSTGSKFKAKLHGDMPKRKAQLPAKMQHAVANSVS